VAECFELSAVTQGGSLDEAAKNLREAVTLALEGQASLIWGSSRRP
jgi:predicted RNase H-like HicB family nuclease